MANGITVRLARIDERQALESMQWRASLENPGDREALLAHPDAISLPMQQIERGQVFVAEDAGALRGFAAIIPRDDGNAELDALFVEPGHWRRGYGKALVDRCAHAARDGGAGALHVIANPHAEGFYTACGFERVGVTQTRFGSGWLMRRTL